MEVETEEEQAASPKFSGDCSSSSSSSACAVDEDANPSLWLDMIQELFDLPPPSPGPAQAPATSSHYFSGADELAADSFGFALQDDIPFPTQAEQLHADSSSFGGIAVLEAPLNVGDDNRPLGGQQSSGAATMEVEPLTGLNRSFSGSTSYADRRSSHHHHHYMTGAYSFPPTGYTRSSGSSAGFMRPGGGASIQKVCSAPQLTYSPVSSTFSWPLAENDSAALQQQQLTHIHQSYLTDHRFLGSYDFTGIGEQHSYHPPEMTSVQRRKLEVERGLGVVHMLLACAEAVAQGNHESAIALLIQLHPLVSKTGSSIQRVAAYFAEAIHARLTHTGGRSYSALLNPFFNPTPLEDVMEAYQVLYQACPYIKFAHFTCNQAIFEAFEGEGRVHIVDLDIVQGYQWPAFMQALAARPGGAPQLRMTGVGTPIDAVRDTGKRLSELAKTLHVPFEFHAVGERPENLKPHMLQRRVGEALAINAINCLHPLLSLPPSNKSLLNLLQMLLEQAPNIFTLVEQEASHNGPFFLSRFLEALHYYSAIFDSLDATLPQQSPDRAKVEMLIFAQEIVNIVACEDGARLKRHEKLSRWRHTMETIGFQSIPFSANAISQSRILLDLYPCNGYMLKESKGALQLGWQDRFIIGASTWR